MVAMGMAPGRADTGGIAAGVDKTGGTIGTGGVAEVDNTGCTVAGVDHTGAGSGAGRPEINPGVTVGTIATVVKDLVAKDPVAKEAARGHRRLLR